MSTSVFASRNDEGVGGGLGEMRKSGIQNIQHTKINLVIKRQNNGLHRGGLEREGDLVNNGSINQAHSAQSNVARGFVVGGDIVNFPVGVDGLFGLKFWV